MTTESTESPEQTPININHNRTATVNPLMLKTKMPGVTVKLPSGGLLYGTRGELDRKVKHGELHVYPMTAMHEIILKSPDKMLSGDSLREVFAHCIPEITNIDEICTKDIDYLMLILRKVSYGDNLTITYTHDCHEKKKHEYVVDLNVLVAQSKSIDPITMASRFMITLPNDQVIQFSPLRYRDAIELMQSTDAEDDKSNVHALFGVILSLIVDVDGITDKSMILEWLGALPVAYITIVLKEVEKVSSWGPDYKYDVKCVDCAETLQLNVPINPSSFFM